MDAYNHIAEICMRRGEFDKAIFYYNEAIKYNPASTDAYVHLGHFYKGREEYNKAAEYFKKASLIDASNVNIHYHLGESYLFMGEIDESYKQVDEIRKINRDKIADDLENKIEQAIESR